MKVIYCWYFNDIWPSLQPINKYSLKFQFSLIFSISVWLCWVYVYLYSYNLLSSYHWPLVEKSRKLFGWKKNCLEIDLTWNTICSTKCYSRRYTLKAVVSLDFEWFFFLIKRTHLGSWLTSSQSVPGNWLQIIENPKMTNPART